MSSASYKILSNLKTRHIGLDLSSFMDFLFGMFFKKYAKLARKEDKKKGAPYLGSLDKKKRSLFDKSLMIFCTKQCDHSKECVIVQCFDATIKFVFGKLIKRRPWLSPF